MRTTAVTAVALTSLFVLSACGSESPGTGAPEAEAATSAAVEPSTNNTADVEGDPSPTPVPTPESAGVTAEFHVDLENADGYTGVLAGTVSIAPFTTEIADAKPGFVDLHRPAPQSQVTFTNTTVGRTAPTPMIVSVAAYYPSTSRVCEAFLTYPPFAAFNFSDEHSDDRLERRTNLGLSADHCFVEVAQLQGWNAGGQSVMDVPANGEVRYDLADGRDDDAARMGQLDEVPEAEADTLIQQLNEPLGVIVFQSEDPALRYMGGIECPALPVTTRWNDAADSQFPLAESTYLVDTGFLC